MAGSNTAAARRARRLEAWSRTLASAPAAESMAVDPLRRGRRFDVADVAVFAIILIFAAVGAHVVFTAVIWGAGALIDRDDDKEKTERIAVAVIEPEPEVEPEIEPEPPKEPEPPDQPEQPKTQPKPQPKPEPPPDPKPEPPKAPPKKITGLDIGSTVEGGGGPSFATGDDLRGKTETVARGPRPDQPPATEQPPEDTTPPKTNRKATRIPQKGVELVKPKQLARVKPNYPPKLRAQGIEGNVVVQVRLDATGAVVEATLVEGAPYEEMNQEALVTARKQRFAPATRDGVPIEFTLTFTVRFRLNDS